MDIPRALRAPSVGEPSALQHSPEMIATCNVGWVGRSSVFSSFLASYRGFAGAAIPMTALDTVFK